MNMPYELWQGDCLERMQGIPDHTVDMVLCDLPYGVTGCHWDTVIPFEPLWTQYKRTIKPGGAIVLFGSQPFSAALVMSNPKWYSHEWIWQKPQGTNFFNVRRMPFKVHEEALVFRGPGGPKTYNPQMTKGTPYRSTNIARYNSIADYTFGDYEINNQGVRYPVSIQRFNRETGLHPTQKPTALCEHLIRTYTDEGDLVLDNCMGSNATGKAALSTKRRYIGIEKDPEIFQTAVTSTQEYAIGIAPWWEE